MVGSVHRLGGGGGGGWGGWEGGRGAACCITSVFLILPVKVVRSSRDSAHARSDQAFTAQSYVKRKPIGTVSFTLTAAGNFGRLYNT